MKISAVLLGTKDALERQRLYLRISDRQKRLHSPTDLFFTEEEFKSGKVTTQHPHHLALNREIRRLLVEKEAEAHGLFERTDKPKDQLLKDYATDLFRKLQRQKERTQGTIDNYTGQLNKFLRFAPGVYVGQIDKKLLDKYKDYCYSLGNCVNSVWSSMKFLKTVLAQAKDDKVIGETPFSAYKMPPYVAPKKEYLTGEDIERVEKFRADPFTPEDLRFAATWFLIGCYTGLRYSDMKAFDRERHLVRGRLVIYTQKTAEPVSMPLNPRVKEWLHSIDYRPLSISNGHYNKLLKLVGSGARVKVKMHGHSSRHSFAVMCADLGISQEVTAKLLGQKSLAATAVYYKLSGKRIDDEYNRLS
jgi:integrase/recombinase XerD